MLFMEWLCSDQPWLVQSSANTFMKMLKRKSASFQMARFLSLLSEDMDMDMDMSSLVRDGAPTLFVSRTDSVKWEPGALLSPRWNDQPLWLKSLARWLNAVLVSLKHFQHKVPRGHKANILQWIGRSLIVNFILCRGPKEMPFSSLSHKNSHKKYKWSLGDYTTTQTTIDGGR